MERERVQAAGKIRVELGRFSKGFKASRAKSVAPKRAKDYEQIEKEIAEPITDYRTDDRLKAPIRKKVEFPKDAFLSRQRVNSAGERSLRFEGVKVG